MADPVAWAFDAGGDYSEELGWKTDVMRAATGGSQHFRLRQSPRVVLGFSALESGRSRRWMEQLVRASSAAAWWAPVSIDTVVLTAAADAGDFSLAAAGAGDSRFLVGGYVMVAGGEPRRYEVREIEAVDADILTLAEPLDFDWPAGTRLVPVRRAHFAEPAQVGRFTADATGLVSVRFRLDEPLDSPAAMPGATYRTFAVFDTFRPVWVSDPQWVPARLEETVDDEVSPVYVADLAGVSMGATTMQYAAVTAEEVAEFRSALFYMAGRWSPVWVPSWTHDLRLVVGSVEGEVWIYVEAGSVTDTALASNRRDIRIELVDGAVLYRRIEDAFIATGMDSLRIDEALPFDLPVSAVQMISFITLSTQDSDTNLLRYVDRTAMQCELVWRELDHEL